MKSIFLAFVLINSVLSAPNRHRRDTDIVFQEPLIAERTPRRFTEEESFLPLFRAPIFVPDTFVESREGVRILNPVHDEYGIPETTTTTTVAPYVEVPPAPVFYGLPIPEVPVVQEIVPVVPESAFDEYGPPALPPVAVVHEEYGPPPPVTTPPPVVVPAIEPFPLLIPPVPEIITTTTEVPTTVYVAPYVAPYPDSTTTTTTTTTTPAPYPEKVTGKYPARVESHYDRDSGIENGFGGVRKTAVRRPDFL